MLHSPSSNTEPITTRARFLRVDAHNPQNLKVLKAVASDARLRVLELLGDRLCNVSEIAKELSMPLSTATLHISALEDSGLITTELQPAERGLQKLCARAYDVIIIDLPQSTPPAQQVVEISMPVGAFADCQIFPTCGLASNSAIIGMLDNPSSFYEPERVSAQLIWFHYGYVEYRFPNRLPPRTSPVNLNLSAEVCSEAPLYHADWPSDITIWVNNVEVCTWTCPADFGGQHGILTPEWWSDRNTQYGLLKVWQINQEGSFIDGMKMSAVTLSDLQIEKHDFISIRIGVKEDAQHVGGMNLFGHGFGNYPQDIVLRLNHRPNRE